MFREMPCKSVFFMRRGSSPHFLSDMEKITSRKNPYIAHIRSVASDADYRREKGEYICDGVKTLMEALHFGAEIVSVMWKEEAKSIEGLSCREQYIVPAELFDYASPMKNSAGPLFSVRITERRSERKIENAIVLENVQDPGNVGTVIRTANALNMDTVILVGACADIYNPKTVRATMGAIFRQNIIRTDIAGLSEILKENTLPLYGAALTDTAADLRNVSLKHTAVAIGSEGRGLSREFLDACTGQIIIPMNPDSESFNAGVAAAIIMWEMMR